MHTSKGLHCLITGGAGFIGTHLAKRLLDRGDSIKIIDIAPPSTSSALNAFGLLDYVEYFQGDIRQTHDLRLLRDYKFDIIFHLAAQPISTLSNLQPAITMAINVDGTRRLCEAVQGHERIVFASSACSYGIPIAGSSPLSEDAPLLPGFYCYSESKQSAEKVLINSGANVRIGRFVNVYGPGDRHFSRIIPRTIKQLMCNEEPRLRRGDGSTVLDFLFVDDVVDALIRLSEFRSNERCAGSEVPVFNFGIGTGHALSIKNLVQMVSIAFDGTTRDPSLPATPQEPPMVKFLDPAKAKRVLGWQPKLRLPEGLPLTIQWYRNNIGSIAHLEDEDFVDFVSRSRVAA